MFMVVLLSQLKCCLRYSTMYVLTFPLILISISKSNSFCDTDVEKLISLVEQQNRRITLLERTVAARQQIEYTSEKSDDGLDKGKRLLSGDQSIQNQEIGFFAYLSKNEANPGTHHTIIFDVTKTNVRNGYNAFSGVFTAPLGGLYVFTCSIRMIGMSAYASYEIMKNADIEGVFFIDAQHSVENRYTTSTVVVQLNQGDIVFVRTSATYTPHGDICSDGFGSSSFAGWRI